MFTEQSLHHSAAALVHAAHPFPPWLHSSDPATSAARSQRAAGSEMGAGWETPPVHRHTQNKKGRPVEIFGAAVLVHVGV